MKTLGQFIKDFFVLLAWLIGLVKATFLKLFHAQKNQLQSKAYAEKFKALEALVIYHVQENLPSVPKDFWQAHHRKILRVIYFFVVAMVVVNFARCVYKPSHISVEPVIQADTISFPGVKKPLNGIRAMSLELGANHTLTLPGRLVWDEDKTAKVYSPFAGRIHTVDVQLGQKIESGQTLAIIQSPEFGQAQADAKKSEALAVLAKASLSRSKELFDHGILAKKEFEQISADAAQAIAEFDRASSRVKSLGAGYKTVDQKFPLKTTISGVVVERNVYPGRDISSDLSNGPIFTVTDPKNLWAVLEASEVDIGRFSEGAEVTLSNNAIPTERLKGKIIHIADFIDPVTRTVKVRVSVPNDSMRLRAEMFIQAEIPLARVEGIVVPSKAVILIGDKHYVFIETELNQFVRKEVKIGSQFADKTEITDGLTAEDRVIVEGSLYLNEILREHVKAEVGKSGWIETIQAYFKQLTGRN
jgi:cobalt-zinc-cadmium efflux system membrane fusion protein